ncbi:uncharacterized components of ribose/xylose transport system [Corynebacterium kutscheri]|uniref:D-ribose pyranase n=1 Tax=Corynebacterium kutscheri TaxID=35755 RepID=A0A0F6QYL1_9CORY|nr:D-ribose pyranase [Corynebacterium kutscheri]AKE40642.1 ABC-type ribose transport system, auxiliary component [Corynebacterium kutscheri]VEH04793.1 uncharacterized components of ribose/xylose transport system [Corynebacterium kutscheri]VEH11039.1 uncharacterized components of ribose/xylose transport system [Corynebacterium kutscheri]VEH80482.1 uncharacterized components of ribose/xylose transport system [Corynebacterium kutscheri]
MLKSGLLNPALNRALARLGHTDTFVIADCGLPIPRTVEVIDLALVFGIPSFEDTFTAIMAQTVVGNATIAKQTPPEIRALLTQQLPTITPIELSHEKLKDQVAQAAFVVRTGSTTAYANVILHSGVAF